MEEIEKIITLSTLVQNDEWLNERQSFDIYSNKILFRKKNPAITDENILGTMSGLRRNYNR